MTENTEVHNNDQASSHDEANKQETGLAEDFTNKQVKSHQIQEHISTKTLDMLPLAPQYRRINIIISLVFGGFFLIITYLGSSGLFFDLPKDAFPFVIGAYALIGFLTLWSATYHFFADPLKQYALRENDLNYQSGLIFRSFVSQPILRIQHIEIKRGPIERRAGMATLQVFSAGGISYTFNIPGLIYENAVELRQFILDHKDLASDV
ncbi:PH domain-containing protein [Glaciecola petra]|uniref:PH domain-containing protein n=1 Tax=Glaciecola petra TaxID=3075602 RepID=A0ABU2ZVM5_9ALTE|nr:PH domain-containing protein [Aestuariibacter sp. P117]MDT0596665.1 PH domain-containing protein [Aestuariibacter sp. P117]